MDEIPVVVEGEVVVVGVVLELEVVFFLMEFVLCGHNRMCPCHRNLCGELSQKDENKVLT